MFYEPYSPVVKITGRRETKLVNYEAPHISDQRLIFCMRQSDLLFYYHWKVCAGIIAPSLRNGTFAGVKSFLTYANTDIQTHLYNLMMVLIICY